MAEIKLAILRKAPAVTHRPATFSGDGTYARTPFVIRPRPAVRMLNYLESVSRNNLSSSAEPDHRISAGESYCYLRDIILVPLLIPRHIEKYEQHGDKKHQQQGRKMQPVPRAQRISLTVRCCR